jgi:hypothetical protein
VILAEDVEVEVLADVGLGQKRQALEIILAADVPGTELELLHAGPVVGHVAVGVPNKAAPFGDQAGKCCPSCRTTRVGKSYILAR